MSDLYLSDAKALFYGDSGVDDEFAFYRAAAAAGRTAADIVYQGDLGSLFPSASTDSLVAAAGTWTNFPELTTAPFTQPPGLVVAQAPVMLAVHSAGGVNTNKFGIRYRINQTGSWHLAASYTVQSYAGGISTIWPMSCSIPTPASTLASRIDIGDTVEVAVAVYSTAGTTCYLFADEATAVWPSLIVTAR